MPAPRRQPHAASPLGPPPHNRHSFPSSSQPWQLATRPTQKSSDRKPQRPTCTKKGFPCRAAAQTHPEDPVGRNHRGLVVDSRELDVDGVARAVLPQARVVGPHSEAVVYRFTAVVDVVDELVLHLVRKGDYWIYYSEYYKIKDFSKAIFRLRLAPPSY